MSGIRISKVKSELALHQSSYDGSAEGDYIGLMKDDESMGATVTYIVPVDRENAVGNMQSTPPHETYYVSLSSPVELYTSNAPTTKKPIKREAQSQPSKAVIAKKRDDKRRATHNEVERRRRDKINTWITRLAALVPDSGSPDCSSKGGILAKACDHITHLNHKHQRLEKLELENEKLAVEVFRLNKELAELRKENASVRNQLADNCIVYTHKDKEQKS